MFKGKPITASFAHKKCLSNTSPPKYRNKLRLIRVNHILKFSLFPYSTYHHIRTPFDGYYFNIFFLFMSIRNEHKESYSQYLSHYSVLILFITATMLIEVNYLEKQNPNATKNKENVKGEIE